MENSYVNCSKPNAEGPAEENPITKQPGQKVNTVATSYNRVTTALMLTYVEVVYLLLNYKNYFPLYCRLFSLKIVNKQQP
jgi:hypothetical protein